MSWENTGNADTNPDTDFLGTTDQQPLVIRTSNIEALRFDPAGRVGVGTTNPASKVEIVGDWKDGLEGALRLTGDKPSIKFAGGALAGNELWALHLGSRGPGNLHFMKQAPSDPPSKFDVVMTLSSGVNALDPAVEISGNWNDGKAGALKLTGDKPSIKFAGGGLSGNARWALHLGSRGPGNLHFMKQAANDPPSKFDVVMTLSSGANALDSAVEINGNWNDGNAGALKLTGDKPSIKFAGGGLAGNALWALHLGSRGPGNLHFMKQAANDPPSKFDVVMTLSSGANALDPAVEINGNWNDGNAGALKLTGDKPSIKFAGGAVAGNELWVLHLGSRGPGNLEFMKQTAPGAFASVLALTPSANVGIGTSRPSSKLEVVGDITVTNGDVRLANADCAEEFDIADGNSADPGTVMVLSEEGELCESRQAYDRRVAGVVSGAGSYKPGIVLDKQASKPNRLALGLLGKLYCKVEAQSSPIEVGDLLTTSSTPGHAMKASDSRKAFGAVIGKALRPLTSGHGLIPILIALQ